MHEYINLTAENIDNEHIYFISMMIHKNLSKDLKVWE